MNKIYKISLIISIFTLFSCKQDKEIIYKTYTCQNESYIVEIPTNVTLTYNTNDFMAFTDESSNSIISIQCIGKENLKGHIQNNDMKHKGFSYNLIKSSDTTSFYKITKGNNMWSAHDFYMLKTINNDNYIIKVCSDHIKSSDMEQMIKHIYKSMKNIESEESQAENKKNNKTNALSKSYSTNNYSIKIPEEWIIKENIDEVTEVYIGSPKEELGFTIVRFETEYTLEEVNNEGRSNLLQTGLYTVSDDEIITIDGVKCYKAIHKIKTSQKQKTTFISYTFKKNSNLYNIKFINTVPHINQTLIDNIINSFRFKK